MTPNKSFQRTVKHHPGVRLELKLTIHHPPCRNNAASIEHRITRDNYSVRPAPSTLLMTKGFIEGHSPFDRLM